MKLVELPFHVAIAFVFIKPLGEFFSAENQLPSCLVCVEAGFETNFLCSLFDGFEEITGAGAEVGYNAVANFVLSFVSGSRNKTVPVHVAANKVPEVLLRNGGHLESV